MSTSWPTLEAQAISAKIEDALSVWNKRDNGWHLKHVEDQAERILVLCSELIVVIGSLRDQVYGELQAYRKG